MTISTLKAASDTALAAYMSAVGSRNVVKRIDAYKVYISAYGAYTVEANNAACDAARAKYVHVVPYGHCGPSLIG